MEKMAYQPNAGQTYIPFQDNIHVPELPYTPLKRPEPAFPALVLTAEFAEKGYVITSEAQHVLPGVTPEMLDWWWANMEKGYYLWAPGSHKRFNWVRPPWQYGFLGSAHMISEVMVPGRPVFGGAGVEIQRQDLRAFPFTACLEHVIVEGIFNGKGEHVDSTIHMWQACPEGCIHIAAGVENTRCSAPPAFVLESSPDSIATPEDRAAHGEYEAARWPVFLPALYALWKDHPDPTQSVRCDLRVRRLAEGGWAYVAENGPVVLQI